MVLYVTMLKSYRSYQGNSSALSNNKFGSEIPKNSKYIFRSIVTLSYCNNANWKYSFLKKIVSILYGNRAQTTQNR